MWKDTTESDGCADQCIKFFVTADGKLEVARRDALDFEILGGVLQDVSMCDLEIQGRNKDDSLLQAREPQRSGIREQL